MIGLSRHRRASCWLGYGPILKFIGRHGGSLNDDMIHVRRAWMTSMTHRELKLIDSQLMGHSINSASFFASTNLLLQSPSPRKPVAQSRACRDGLWGLSPLAL